MRAGGQFLLSGIATVDGDGNLPASLPSLHMAVTLTYEHAPADGEPAAQSVYDKNHKEISGELYDKS